MPRGPSAVSRHGRRFETAEVCETAHDGYGSPRDPKTDALTCRWSRHWLHRGSWCGAGTAVLAFWAWCSPSSGRQARRARSRVAASEPRHPACGRDTGSRRMSAVFVEYFRAPDRATAARAGWRGIAGSRLDGFRTGLMPEVEMGMLLALAQDRPWTA